MSSPKKLRLMTYLSSGIPIQVFELLLHYLEEVTGMEGYLITESRWSGPPAERGDPFIDDIADVGELWELLLFGIKHDEFTNNEEFFEVHIFKYRWLQIKSCFTMSNNFWSTKNIFDGKLRTYSVDGRLTFAVSVITLY